MHDACPVCLIFIVVDQALEVVDEYQGRILKIEQQVLLKPSVKTVRRRKCPVPLSPVAPPPLLSRFVLLIDEANS